MKDGLLDRVTRLEGLVSEMLKTLQAVCRVAGVSEVQAELAQAICAEMEQSVATNLKEGKLFPTETSTADTLVVGVEQDPQGRPVFPGRFQAFPKDLDDSARVALLGRKAGDHVTLPNGGHMQITGVYSTTAPADQNAEPVN